MTTCRIVASLRRSANSCEHGGVRAFRVLATAALALHLACATARPSTAPGTPLAVRVEAQGIAFRVVYRAEDASEVPRVEAALLRASGSAIRWGSFRESVTIRVFPDHLSLEEAVDRRGYPWLRAWAFSNQILLQSPRTWAADGAARDAELTELLTHELTHALMYQRMQPAAWTAEEPPLWFREGMASVTAEQGHKRLSADELRRWTAANPEANLLRPPADLYRDQKDAVYGAAHRAFELLLRTSGDDAIRDLLRRAGAGASFADAFRAATGHGLTEFEDAAIRGGFGATGVGGT